MIRTIFLAFLIPFTAGCIKEKTLRKELPPNILIITVDNLGYGDFKIFNPKSPIITPNIDKLASDGAVLTSFYSASPTCTASRAALLTGRIPQRNKLDYQLGGIAGNYGIGLRHSEILIPQLLKKASVPYATGAFGKWNVGFAPGSRPTERGFDEFLGHVSGNINYYSHIYNGKHDLYHNTEQIDRKGEYSTDLFANAAIDFIREKSKKSVPWFVYLPFNAPHSPNPGNKSPGEVNQYQAPAWALNLYNLSPQSNDTLRRYYAVVTAVDSALGRVINCLDSLDIGHNTFIFLFSDNGGNVGELFSSGLEVASNYPLRGGRPTLYEGGIRVPAIAKWPGKIKPSSIIEARLWTPDLLPACAKLAGAPLPDDRVIDGMNPLPVLTGQTKQSPHASLFFEYRKYAALCWGDWKIIRESPEDDWQLYNINDDMSENNDLADQRKDLAEHLMSVFILKKEELSHSD